MLPIRWSEAALDDLDRITSYIAGSNPIAAFKLQERIETAVMPLSAYPYLCRTGRVEGTRELVPHPNYIVIYRVRSDFVEVVAVLHAHREYP